MAKMESWLAGRGEKVVDLKVRKKYFQKFWNVSVLK